VRALIILLVTLWAQTASAADLLLRWPALPDADGYRLYVGTQSRHYTQAQDLASLTADTVGGIVHFLATGFQPGRYVFAVTAYNSAGESDYSNEKEVLFGAIKPPVARAGLSRVGAAQPCGRGVWRATAANGENMKKGKTRERKWDDRDTMRPEYDFRGAVRGVTAARYAEGTNVVAVDPDVRDVFPDSTTVNEALRALAPLLREQRVAKGSRTRRSSRPA